MPLHEDYQYGELYQQRDTPFIVTLITFVFVVAMAFLSLAGIILIFRWGK